MKKNDVRDAFARVNPVIQFCYFLAVILTTVFVTHPVILLGSLIGAVSSRFLQKRGGHKGEFFASLALFLVIVCFNAMFEHYGVTVLFTINTGAVTLEALVYGAVLALMLWVSILWFVYFNHIFTTDRFIYLFGRIVPVFSLVISMIIRFVPLFCRQLTQIREAGRASRPHRGRFCRVKNFVASASILVTWSLEHALQTADSMRARGYGSGHRTSYARFAFGRNDALSAAVLAVLYGYCFVGFCRGDAAAQYNPVIKISSLTLSVHTVVFYGAWLIFCLFPVLMAGANAALSAYRKRNRRGKEADIWYLNS